MLIRLICDNQNHQWAYFTMWQNCPWRLFVTVCYTVYSLPVPCTQSSTWA